MWIRFWSISFGSNGPHHELSKWKTSNTYDTADECKKVLLGLRGGWVGYANGHELNHPSRKRYRRVHRDQRPGASRKNSAPQIDAEALAPKVHGSPPFADVELRH